MRIGVIGAGNMGLAMVQRLREKDWPVVVRDIDPAREALARAAGASISDSAADLGAACDSVIVVVVDAPQVERVLHGDGAGRGRRPGLLQGLREGATVLLCPTLGPDEVIDFGRQLSALRLHCIDAPMSGGPERARAGRMSLMLAGDAAVIERHGPLFDILSDHVFMIGERLGDAARTKLVNNLLAAVNLAGTAEVLALAQHWGLDARRTLEVIEQSSGQSWIGSDRMRRALDGDLVPRAHTGLLAKDTRLALEAAAAAGVRPAVGTSAAALFARACEQGWSQADDSSLLRFLGGWTAS